jgi:hypothetical protein
VHLLLAEGGGIGMARIGGAGSVIIGDHDGGDGGANDRSYVAAEPAFWMP